MNERELDEVLEELQSLVDKPISGAWQPSRDQVILEVGSSLLLLRPRGPHARLHLVTSRPRNPQNPFSFQGAVRAHVSGRLLRIDRVPGDRIVLLTFERGALHLRLTGRSGGLWLLDGERVLAAYDGPTPAGLPPVPCPPPLAGGRARFVPQGQESWNEAAADYFRRRELEEQLRQTRVEISRDLRRELDRCRRLIEGLSEDLERSSTAHLLRRQADGLAATLHTIPTGASAVVVPDLDEPGRSWAIELDPARPPVVTMERLYRDARRRERAGDQVLERLITSEERIARLSSALAEVETSELDRLRALRALLPARSRRARDDGAARPWVTWSGPRGQEILVGRNAKGNRRLTFQVARGRDWWMHLRGAPGAHVVIRCAGADHSPSLELLLAAAQITLIHGRIPEGASAEVQYTRVRDVRSIPGESEGRVRVSGEKVLHVTRDRVVLDGWTRDA